MAERNWPLTRPQHIDRLKDDIATAADIEQRCVRAGPDHVEQLERVFKVRTNLGTLIRLAQGKLIDVDRCNIALEAIRVALEDLDDEEKRAVVKAVIVNVAAEMDGAAEPPKLN